MRAPRRGRDIGDETGKADNHCKCGKRSGRTDPRMKSMNRQTSRTSASYVTRRDAELFCERWIAMQAEARRLQRVVIRLLPEAIASGSARFRTIHLQTLVASLVSPATFSSKTAPFRVSPVAAGAIASEDDIFGSVDLDQLGCRRVRLAIAGELDSQRGGDCFLGQPEERLP